MMPVDAGADHLEKMQKEMRDLDKRLDALRRDSEEHERRRKGINGFLRRAMGSSADEKKALLREEEMKALDFERHKLSDQFNKQREMLMREKEQEMRAMAALTQGAPKEVAVMRPIRFKQRDGAGVR